MKQLKQWMLAAILICGTTTVLTSCSSNDDNSTPANPENAPSDYSINLNYS